MALTAGHTITCAPNSGGVRRVAITERSNIASWTLGAGGDVATLTMVATKKFFVFEAEQETIEFIEEGKYTNKTTVFTQMLDMSWVNWAIADRASLLELYSNSACGLVVIHLEETGTPWIWGLLPTDTAESVKFVARMEKSTRKTGKKLDDVAQTDIQLKAVNIVPATKFTPGWAGVPLT